MVIYILIKEFVIHCVFPQGMCMQISSADFAPLFIGGFVELIFELKGVVKIYRKLYKDF